MAGDANGGVYVFDTTSNATDDGYKVVKPVGGFAAGRWLLSVGRGLQGPTGPVGPAGPTGSTGGTGPAGDAKLIADPLAFKSRIHTLGDVLSTAIYGGSVWKIVKKVELQPDFYGSLNPPGNDSSVVDYDDDLHMVVTLNDGTTGMAELQLGSIAGYVQQLYTKQYAQVIARLRQAPSLGRAATIVCYGDSITFGQVGDPNYPGANQTLNQPTGSGDGSIHHFNQLAAPWPETMKSFADQVFGIDKVAVINRGYSGDRVGTSYRRSRFAVGQNISYIALGTNDQLFATSNGTDQTGLFKTDDGYGGSYAFERFTSAYRKYIYREILRGSVPIIMTPAPHFSLLGYDGTLLSAAKILAYYNNALHALAKEFDLLVLDGADILGNYDNATVTTDGIHPNGLGANIMAARAIAPLCGRGWHNPEVIVGERSLTASVLTESIEGFGVREVTNTLNTNSRGRPFDTDRALDLVINSDTGRLFYSFRLDEDEKAVFPIGYASENTQFNYNADFGITTPAVKLTMNETKPINVRDLFPGDRQIATTAARQYMSEAAFGSPLIITGKGWHTVSIGVGTGALVLNGLRFVNDAGWRTLALSSGFTQYGNIAPAYRVRDAVLEFRGIVLNPSVSTTADMFNVPAEAVPYLPVLMGAQPTRYATTPIALTITSSKVQWVANDETAGGVNILNLAHIKMPFLLTV